MNRNGRLKNIWMAVKWTLLLLVIVVALGVGLASCIGLMVRVYRLAAG